MPSLLITFVGQGTKAKSDFAHAKSLIGITKFSVYSYCLSFTGHVFNPIKEYIGQKLTRLVSTKIAAKANKIIPKAPGIVPVK